LLLLAIAQPLGLAADSGGQNQSDAAGRSIYDVVISEFLASASTAAYNGTDWNGDGVIGSESDQYIELHNTGSESVDIGGLWLDDADGESTSAPCEIGDGTILEPDERLPFFRARTGLVLDYWGGDAVRLLTADGSVLDEQSYPDQDSWYDVPYVRNESSGGVDKIEGPTPGWGPGETPSTAGEGGRCYPPTDHIHRGAYALSGRIVTMGDRDVIESGGVMVVDGTIAAVWDAASESSPTSVIVGGEIVDVSDVDVLPTYGTIYPGLVNTHDHLHYNHMPLWDYDLEGGQFYTNRYQWKDNPGYKPEVTWGKTFIQQSNYWNLESQALKHSEMKQIAGGTTSIQGNPTHDEPMYASILARNIEHHNFGRDYMHTKVTELTSTYQGNHIKSGNASGTLDAWFLHLSEGTDSSSRAEFEILEQNGLLVGELIVIHGVPLREQEFGAMAQVGASLVWSPTSNLLLYGDTARVDLAKAAGVRISLAPDWSPSGSKGALHELKIADLWNQRELAGTFTDRELVEMVTINAVDSMKWTDDVGRIKPGLAADLVVIDTFHTDPYRNLIEAIDPDVRLTVVGGLAVFGDEDLMSALKGGDYEMVQGAGFRKALDVTFPGVPNGGESWSTIQSRLEAAMLFNRDSMYENFSYASGMSRSEFDAWMGGTYADLDAIRLDPIFTLGDERYFDVLNRSAPFNSKGPIDLWSTYYDIPLTETGHRNGSLAPGNATGGGTGGGGTNGGSGSNGGESDGGESDVGNGGWSDAPVTIPALLPTYGPLGLDSHPYDSSIEAGIHLEICSTNETHEDGRVRACGAVIILIDPADGCFVERGLDSELAWTDPCESRSTWNTSHPEVSESAADGGSGVSRLNPSRGSGSVIAFPGKLCDDPIVTMPLIPAVNGNEAERAEDDRSGDWLCRQASKWVDASSQSNATGDANGSRVTNLEDVEGSSWMDSNLFYVALAGALFVLIASVAAIVVGLRRS